MTDIVVKARKRELTGKSAAKKFRAQGLVPAEFYYHGEKNFHLLVNRKDFEYVLSHSHSLLSLELEGQKKKYQCIVKDVQFDPVRGDVLHVDFQGVKKGQKITVTVPVILKGTAAGVKTGGILEHLIRELEIECLPNDLPEKLEVDVTNVKVGEAIHVKDLHFKNIKILDDPEETVLLIEAPRLAKEGEVEEEAAEEEIKEPEVITAKKEE